MKPKDQIARLQQITQLMLDARLNDLEVAARAKAESQARLAGLQGGCAEDVSAVAAAQAEMLYQRWADARRAEINMTLARQTAEWMEAREAARCAFARTEALRALAAKQR